MASAVDSRLAYARLSAVATASRLPTANRGSNNSYTTSWDTTQIWYAFPSIPLTGSFDPKPKFMHTSPNLGISLSNVSAYGTD